MNLMILVKINQLSTVNGDSMSSSTLSRKTAVLTYYPSIKHQDLARDDYILTLCHSTCVLSQLSMFINMKRAQNFTRAICVHCPFIPNNPRVQFRSQLTCNKINIGSQHKGTVSFIACSRIDIHI